MISMNCELDFDSGFWVSFDTAMMQEWNITTTTTCLSVKDFPSSFYAYKELANKILAQQYSSSTVVEGQASDFTTYINGLLDRNLPDMREEQIIFLTEHSETVFRKPLASGITYPTENLGFVENNFEYSTAAVSHEILHLVLQAEGYEKSCYVDKVHENQFRYEMQKIGKNEYPVIKKFDC